MKLTIVQHVPFEIPGLISEWAAKNHYQIDLVQLFNNDQHLPDPSDVAFLIVLGGPMSANDDLPWLSQERQLIKAVVNANKPMLGICLGAQQLAKVFGQPIIPTPKEVGFGPVTSSPLAQLLFNAQDHYLVLHWHGEGFETPQGGRPLFSSQYWPNQGFSYKSAIGLQFHLESTPASLKELVTTDAAFIAGSKFAGNENDILNKNFDPNCRTLLFNILNHLTEQIE